MKKNVVGYPSRQKIKHAAWLLAILFVGIVAGLFPNRSVRAASFVIDSAGDTDDVSPGNGVCADSNGDCTLRAAIRETNALSGADTITFDSSLDGTPIELSIPGVGEGDAVTGDLDLEGDLTITGNGVENTIIDANTIDRVFQLDFGITVDMNAFTIRGGGNLPAGTFTSYGAGILTQGNLTLNQVRITGNAATELGGGIYNWNGSLTINDSTLDSNLAPVSGGGIYSVAPMTINNSTISGNTAVDFGGGVRVESNTTTLNYSTVAGNTANSDGNMTGGGGGLAQSGGTLNILSTIVADNISLGGASRQDCVGTITSLDYNLVENTSGCTIVGATTNNISNITTTLSPLGDNAGPTPTHALLTNSPAIDLIPAGINGCGTTYTTDQRGFIRPIDGDGNMTGECDIGALESLQVCQVAISTPYSLDTVTFEVQTLGNIECFLVVPYNENHPNALPNLQTGSYWQLGAFDNTGVVATGYTLSLTIAGPFNFTPDADDKLCRYTGSGWDCGLSSDHTFTVGPDSITRSNVTQLSPWTAGNNVGPTAITLQTLTARSANVVITWVALTFLSLGSLFLFASNHPASKRTTPNK